ATVSGSGVATRADARLPIVIRGVDADRFLAIVDLRSSIVDGSFDLSGGNVVVGVSLASELGVGVGNKFRVASTEGIEDVVTIARTIELGNEAVDKTWVVTALRHAQSLFALPGGATTIELKVADVFESDRIAAEIEARTGAVSESWMTMIAELLSGLSAQNTSKTMIQFFVVVTVALGIASELIVSVVQKSREIGILRAVRTPPRRILAVFLIQGGILGLAGSIVGSALGVAFALLFESLTRNPDGEPRFLVQVDLALLVSSTAL